MSEAAGLEEVFANLEAALPAGTPRAAVAFAAEARAVLGFDEPGDALALDEAANGLGRAGTDVASGLRAALGVLPPDVAGVVVLVSDGRATEPGAEAAALECRVRGAPVFAFAPPGGATRDFRLEALHAPAAVEAGRPVPLAAVVSSSVGGRARVILRRSPGGREIARAEVAIAAGAPARALFRDRPESAGVFRYEAWLEPAEGGPDAFPENDRAEAAVLVRGRPEVLLATRGGGIRGILDGDPERRFEVRPVGPEGLPASADALARYAAVILEGLAREDVPPAAEAALVRYVEGGGGVLVTGGPRAFGAGGWRDGAPLTELLPVKMAPGPLKRTLLVLLVDASGSMAGEGSRGRAKIEDAREAVASIAGLSELGPEDEIAIVAFRAEAELALGPTPVREKERILSAARGLAAAGRTSLAAPLRKGIEVLAASAAKKKVAVLLSDGEPTVEADPELLSRLARPYGGKDSGLYVLGTNPSKAHQGLLRTLAEEGGGTAVFESDYGEILRELRKLVSAATGRYVLRGEVALAAASPSSPVIEGLPPLPALAGLNRTQAKPLAETVLAVPSGEPVLALGRAGPGRTAAFTSGFGGSWAGALGRWPGRLRLLSQLLRAITPPPPDEGFEAKVLRDGGEFHVEVAAKDAGGAPRNLLDLSVELWPLEGPAAGAEREGALLPARQVALGRYQARLEDAALPLRAVARTRTGAGSFLARVLLREGGGREGPREVLRAPLTLPPPAELLRTGVDYGSLDEIAAASGGRILTGASGLAEALESARGRVRREATAYLAAGALALVIIELATRALAGWLARPGT
jgi:uncharacterized membrane protein